MADPSDPATITVTITGIFEPCPTCNAAVEILSTSHGPLGIRTVGADLYLTPHTATCPGESYGE